MDHARFKQVASDGTTLYLSAFGVMAELVAPGTAGARWNDYLSVGNVKVGVRFLDVAATTVTTRYYHTDHTERVQQKWKPVLRPNALLILKSALSGRPTGFHSA